MVRFIFSTSGHLSQLRSPFFTVNQELPFLWALGRFLFLRFCLAFAQVLFLWEGFALFSSLLLSEKTNV